MPTEFMQAYLSASPAQREAAYNELTGKTANVAATVNAEPMPRSVKVKTAEQLTGLTARSLRRAAAMGLLVPVKYCGSKKAWGYTEASVRKFIEGSAKPVNATAEARHEVEVEVV